MGGFISKYSELTSNEYLTKFCKEQHISSNDPFWNRFLAYNIRPPTSNDEQLLFDEAVESHLQLFLANNSYSCNLNSLVQVFITRATELLSSPTTDNVMLAWQTFNALFVIKCITKYLVEMVPKWLFDQHFDGFSDEVSDEEEHNETDSTQVLGPSQIAVFAIKKRSPRRKKREIVADDAANASTAPAEQTALENGAQKEKYVSSESMLEMLIDALVGLIIDVPVTDDTYYLHLEAINTILIHLSAFVFSNLHKDNQPTSKENFYVYSLIFHGRYSIHAPLLIKTLLQNVYTLHLSPETMFREEQSGGSIVMGLASGIWSLLTLNTSSAKRASVLALPSLDRDPLQDKLRSDHPVANQSCLLALVLTNHCAGSDNLFRKALHSVEDANEPSSNVNAGLRIDVSSLHAALCRCAQSEPFTLLLYLMVQGCPAYRKHVTLRADIEDMVVPLSRNLYSAAEYNPHHIYMSLIVLLILTEDDKFNKRIHEIYLSQVPWYTERSIAEISLGGLMILVIVRMVQYNMLRVRDRYLHTNCLAALANMSGEFRNLHPYVAQRLVSLFETLSKRQNKLIHQVGGSAVVDIETAKNEATPNGDVTGNHSVSVDIAPELLPQNIKQEMVQDIQALEEVLRMLLEILNSCLAHQLQANVNLVYALLYKKHLFTQYRTNPAFQDIIQNIEMVIGYFSSRLQRVQEQRGSDLGVSEVMNAIKKGGEQWSSDRLRKFPDLKFRYVEEDKPEEFFTPYVWSLTAVYGTLYWVSEGGYKALKDLVDNMT